MKKIKRYFLLAKWFLKDCCLESKRLKDKALEHEINELLNKG